MVKNIKNEKKPMAFVIMPFDSEFDDFYKDFIKKNLEELGYKVIRADDIQSQRNILQDIVSALYSCDLIIADLTVANSNVFYELGLAHALKKRVILLTQELSDIPFDLRSYRMIQYDTHFARIKESERKFRSLAKSAIKGDVIFGNPITDFESASTDEIKTSKEVISKKIENEMKKDDRGLIDHVIDYQEGMEELVEVLQGISNATEEIGDEAIESTSEIELLSSKSPKLKPILARNIIKKIAKKLENYKDIISTENDKYLIINQKIENSLEFIISFQEFKNKDEREEFKKGIGKLNSLEEKAEEAKSSLLSFYESIKNLPKMEKTWNRAVYLTSSEVNRLINYLDKTISQIRRARITGEKKLKG